MLDKAHAPFTPDQVASLNAYQVAGVMHPFTCGGDDCRVRLIAAEDGWHCASQTCDYHQLWAHAFMADWSWKTFSWRPQPNADDVLGAEFETHAEESLALANEAFDAVVETWPRYCHCPEMCEGGPECLDDEGGPLPRADGEE